MRVKKRVSVYNYTDYRKYLADYFADAKEHQNGFSYRKFATRAGYNSSGLLLDVINGRTNIQSDVIAKFARGVGLNRSESEYFENLVRFNQSKTVDSRTQYFKNMMRQLAGKVTTVNAENHKYYSEWYFVAIREYLSTCEFKGDYAKLARELQPHISVSEAKKAIAFLLKKGFIRTEKSGRFVASTQSLTTAPEIKSLAIANFQRKVLELAMQAIDRFKPEERNISTLTFSASDEAMRDIKAEIDASRTRIRAIIEKSSGEERVFQYNVQLFPLSKKKRG